jgi:uncharacterized membrane protein YraQ (UPF0718 family)
VGRTHGRPDRHIVKTAIALSLPEFIILRKVLKPRLIAVFIGVVGIGIMAVGYLFNALSLQ